jgi:hypothetical protein
MRPDIDRARLSRDTRQWIADNRLSTRRATDIYPGLNPAMISRACSEAVLSAASLLTLCAAMRKDPMDYLAMRDSPSKNQAVTANVSRETRERA